MLNELARVLKHQAIRTELYRRLSGAPERGFLELIWAVDALQSDREEMAKKVLGPLYPSGAVRAKPGSPYATYPWELETLVNEFLTDVPLANLGDQSVPRVGFRRWTDVATWVNILRNLEDQEYRDLCNPREVLRELPKIAARQFEWQRGFTNVPQFYRSAFIYGGELCSEFLRETFGTSINELTLIGFAIYAACMQDPAVARTIDLEIVGANQATLERVLGRICKPLPELRSLARIERQGWPFTAYRPSVLRSFPCISFGSKRPVILSPIPDLILARVTQGIFYDVIGGGGPVRNEYGHRFEEYCWRYIKGQLPALPLAREWRYKVRKQPYDSPDLIVSRRDEVCMAIECKASRMSVRARLDDQASDDRGFNELAKGIFQVWRFFSHCRTESTGMAVADDAIGMILTLDGWLVMGDAHRTELFKRAGELADEDPRIAEVDRKPVILCQITNLESTLADANERSFLMAVRAAATQDQYRGWLLSNVHSELEPSDRPQGPRKHYPFENLEELLPWWRIMKERRKDLKMRVPI